MADEVPKPESEGSSKPANLLLPDQILPPNLFVLPMTSNVVFPTLMAPIVVAIPRFVATVEESISRQRIIGLILTKKAPPTPDTKPEDLFSVGVAVKILKRLKIPDGSVNLLVHSIRRFKVARVLSDRPHMVVEAQYLEDEIERSNHMDALVRLVVNSVKKLSEVNPYFSEEMKLAMINAPTPGTLADLVGFALSLNKSQTQELLETVVVKERLEKLLLYLKREQDLAELQRKIHEDVNSKINSMQREYFLKEQLKVIKKELGIEEDDKSKSGRKFKERIESSGMPDDVKKVALEELTKFETLSESSPEYNVTRNYLETLVSLPWNKETPDKLDLTEAEKILNEDHYGIEKVKERILQILAVRQLNEEKAKTNQKEAHKGSIICLVGPPGVGKTSVGKSVARALGRKFFRFSLGGMRDEAEIKGHRRTYVGALPGKIIQALKRVESKNPVLMLDEIDKLGVSFQGDPASALLEVLDPEQNKAFLDHFVDVPFDLSNVLFIATANTMSTIPEPLLDRMEIIEMPGYTLEEKVEIAEKFVIPRVLNENGLNPGQLRIQTPALLKLLSDYAREPGLRSLQLAVEKIARKAAARIVKQRKPNAKLVNNAKPINVFSKDLVDWIGPQRFYNEVSERIRVPGVVVGLAWTATGGDILFIEATQTPGDGKLKFTGNLGDVMSESAEIAWSFVKKKLWEQYGYTQDFFKSKDLHLHIPAGAIPKDGPSAGITMAAAFYSLLTSRVFKQKTAMTGELSLTGKVLPVGGIKEKLLAARRAGVETVLLPKLNMKDLHEVPKYALKGLKIVPVSTANEVIEQIWGKAALKKAKPTVLTPDARTPDTPSKETESAQIQMHRPQRH